jgi:hypothetical protein
VSALKPPIYGLMAEFESVHGIVHAARKVREAGYRKVDAYTPYPIEELMDALDLHRNKLPLVVLIGGIIGAIAGYGLQYWSSVIAYPLNVGGRPLHSWPAFIVPTFETTILFAGISAVVGMIALNGLPQPYHPVFNNPRFAMASRNRFFLVLEATDPKFDRKESLDFFKTLEATEVTEVAH